MSQSDLDLPLPMVDDTVMNLPLLQPLPSRGPQREELRQKGQFWTPEWVAEAMMAWVGRDTVDALDPAVGAGAFPRAARRLGLPIAFHGTELHATELATAQDLGMHPEDLQRIAIADFMTHDFGRRFPAIVANPPYIRHHRFDAAYKAALRSFVTERTGLVLDGRAGLHVYFLVKALSLLEPGGRLAFIVPADICEGRFSSTLWRWIAAHYSIEAVATFAPAASPFPRVDTNALILFIRAAPPVSHLSWAQVRQAGTDALRRWCAADFGTMDTPELVSGDREMAEALRTGFSRPPAKTSPDDTSLGSLFRVVRGIATGDNDFFFLTSARLRELGLPPAVFRRALGRTRDLSADVVRAHHLDALDEAGRPTFLLSLGREAADRLPAPVRRYLAQGEAAGLPQRPLIGQRSPWYRMEQREPPPWLFAYLGRRSCRFIRNHAGVVPLTGFLCVYPRDDLPLDLEAATSLLNDPRTIAALPLVAKSYGGGALKVEPRSLERLPIPAAVLADHGIRPGGRLL